MALFYQPLEKCSISTEDVIETEDATNSDEIQVHEAEGPCIKYDFSKHVLIELLDNVTLEAKLWKELGLVQNKEVAHKRLLVDPHRKNCRRAIVVCTSSDAAKEMAKRLTQSKIKKRCICAVVVHELLSDLHKFEKQIIQYGDKGSQQQLVYVTDLNRPREPASLARYLREKFSPFGTILSVFVSEGKDGYAFPEGVIRFAHLSEAFAAELAYDQCAVAMERLSVTTHHNILLSQCDLKSRLKEAKLRFSKKTDSHQNDCDATAPKLIGAVNCHGSDRDRSRGKSDSSSVTSEVPLEPNTRNVGQTDTNHASSTAVQDEFPTYSAELDDALKNSCNENLVDCLKCITMDSESSFSKQASTISASGSEAREIDQEIPQRSSPITVLGDRSWSSRIMGWITDIPNADDMRSYNDTLEARRLSGGSTDHEHHGESQNRSKQQQPMDIVSNSESFVTCENGDVTASYNSAPSSPASTVRFEGNSFNDNLQLDRSSTPAKSCLSPAGLDNRHSPESSKLSLKSGDICPVSNSQKRKNSSLMTQKLSKTQRLDCTRALSVSETETTINLPSVSNNRQCYVVLNSLPELNELARSFTSINALQSTNAPEIVASSQKSPLERNTQLPTSSKDLQHSTGSTISEACSSKSNMSVRRSSRLTNNQDNQKPSSLSGTNSNKNVKLSSSNFFGRENRLLDGKEDSPLQTMLKNELKTSSANKDVSITRKLRKR